MQDDAEQYIKYYNQTRMHTTLNDLTPIEFESVNKMCTA